MTLSGISSGFPWWAWFGIAGICASVIRSLAKNRHAERMAMIEKGLNPDEKPH